MGPSDDAFDAAFSGLVGFHGSGMRGPQGQGMFGNGMGGMAAQMLLGPFLQKQMTNYGMTPGQYNPMQGWADQQRFAAYRRAQDASTTAARRHDAQTYQHFFRGGSAMAGMGWSPEAHAKAGVLGGDMAKFLPMISHLDPQLYDQLHGSSGSASLAAMNLHRIGQYSIDPTTGKRGVSAANAGKVADELFQAHWGPSADLKKMRGFGAGEGTAIYEQLAMRGMGGSFDSKSIGKKVQGMTGALAAMQDLFGDAGHPNAPVAKLFKGLEALSQNGLASKSPAELQGKVRQLHHAMKHSGMSLEAVMGLTGHVAELADKKGLERDTVVMDTVRSIGHFGAAIGQFGKLDIPIHGSLSQEQMQMVHGQLMVNAKASPLANRMGALKRMAAAGLFKGKEGKDAALAAAALERGDTHFVGSKGRQAVADVMGYESFMALTKDAGIHAEAAKNTLRATHLNQEYTDSTVTKIVRNAMGGDLTRLMGNEAGTAIRGQLRGIVSGKGSDAVGQALAKAMFASTREEMATTASQTKYLTGHLEAALVAQGVPAAKIAKMAADGTLGQIVTSAWGAVDQRAHKDPRFKGTKSGEGMLQMHRDNLLGGAAADEAAGAAGAATDAATDTINRDSAVARFANMMKDYKPGDDRMAAVSKAMAGIDVKDLDTSNPQVKAWVDEIKKLGKGASGGVDTPAGGASGAVPPGPGATDSAGTKPGGDMKVTGTLDIKNLRQAMIELLAAGSSSNAAGGAVQTTPLAG